MYMKDLKIMAKECHIKGYSNLNKSELVKLLLTSKYKKCITPSYKKKSDILVAPKKIIKINKNNKKITIKKAKPIQKNENNVIDKNLMIELSNINISDLKSIAKSCGAKGYSTMNKKKLIELLSNDTNFCCTKLKVLQKVPNHEVNINLNDYNLVQLKNIARNCGVKGFSTMKKNKLIETLEENVDLDCVITNLNKTPLKKQKASPTQKQNTFIVKNLDEALLKTEVMYQKLYKKNIIKPYVGFRFIIGRKNERFLYDNYVISEIKFKSGQKTIREATARKVDLMGNFLDDYDYIVVIEKFWNFYAWVFKTNPDKTIMNFKQVGTNKPQQIKYVATDLGFKIHNKDDPRVLYTTKILKQTGKIKFYENFLVGYKILVKVGIVQQTTYVVSKVEHNIIYLTNVFFKELTIGGFNDNVPHEMFLEYDKDYNLIPYTMKGVQIKSQYISIDPGYVYSHHSYFPNDFYKRDLIYDKKDNIKLYQNLLIGVKLKTDSTDYAATYSVDNNLPPKNNLYTLKIIYSSLPASLPDQIDVKYQNGIFVTLKTSSSYLNKYIDKFVFYPGEIFKNYMFYDAGN